MRLLSCFHIFTRPSNGNNSGNRRRGGADSRSRSKREHRSATALLFPTAIVNSLCGTRHLLYTCCEMQGAARPRHTPDACKHCILSLWLASSSTACCLPNLHVHLSCVAQQFLVGSLPHKDHNTLRSSFLASFVSAPTPNPPTVPLIKQFAIQLAIRTIIFFHLCRSVSTPPVFFFF